MAPVISSQQSPISNTPVPGLKGLGVIRFGNESRLELRDRLQMTRELFARAVGVSVRTIAKVEADAVRVEKLTRPYNELFRLCETLAEVVPAAGLGGWFMAPNRAFEDLKPLEVIERGEIDRLWEMAFRLRSGMVG